MRACRSSAQQGADDKQSEGEESVEIQDELAKLTELQNKSGNKDEKPKPPKRTKTGKKPGAKPKPGAK